MKNFVKENWYKLMLGSSMMMASFGFMIYAISPAYSNSDKEKTEIKNTDIQNSLAGNNGVIHDGYAYFVDGGYMYVCDIDKLDVFSGYKIDKEFTWSRNEFGWPSSIGFQKFGGKYKLP
jgi:hypothetical protein